MILATMLSSLLQRAAEVPSMVRRISGRILHGTDPQRRAVPVRVPVRPRRIR